MTGSGITADDLKERTKRFAHRCVKLATNLPDVPVGRHIKNQLIGQELQLERITKRLALPIQRQALSRQEKPGKKDDNK